MKNSHSFDDERERVGRLHARRVDLFLARRIVPRLRLLGAVERNEDEALGRISVEADYLLCAYDVVTTRGRERRGSRLVDDASLEGRGVIYFPDGDDDVSRRLRLGVKALNRR